MRDQAIYEDHKNKRINFSKNVLDSDAKKMIVMAGPGTGKSFLFQQLAKKYRDQGKDNIIVLSFINELVKDLTRDMHGLAQVSTLHSFAAKELKLAKPIYMDLLRVVKDDLKIEKNEDKQLDSILHNLDLSETNSIDYLRARRDYYKYLDPSSMVFELVQHYAAHPELIPSFDLVLVDEYQDFNLLEVELINLLANKNNILIAGDDDQSLYSFKHSVPDNIREKHQSGIYTPFSLPYCSRSTEVVIDAFHDVVNFAKSEGHITERIAKDYIYFPNEEKDLISALYPKIVVHKNIQQIQNAYYIDKEIANIFEVEPKFEVLVICSLKSQINALAAALRKKGYSNISGDGLPTQNTQRLSDGIGMLIEDTKSNLGWRLCTESIMDADAFNGLLLQTVGLDKDFVDCVPSAVKKEIKALRAVASKLKTNKELSDDQRELIFRRLEINPSMLAEKTASERIFASKSGHVYSDTKIKITTILGSKGLSYDYVFMINFDDKYLIPSGGIDDESINKFLVALTRSKKKIIIHTAQKTTEPKFISWIAANKKQIV